MDINALDNPYGIPLSMDFPQSPARWDIPLWSENYIFQGSDPDKGIFFYHLIGRMAGNPDHWRAVFQCTLPSGEILAWKSYGRDLDPHGPATPQFRAHCVEPFRRWRIQYDGVAASTTREQNRTDFLPATAQPEPVEFDVMWDGNTPMWKVGAEAAEHAEKHPVWNIHLEQAGTVRGHLRYRGELITFEGPGYRDHSVGPRELSTGDNHAWLQASFPTSRRHFGLITLAFTTGDRHTNGFVSSRGCLQDCKVLQFPMWPEGERLYDVSPFTVSLDTPDDGVITFTGEVCDPSFYFTVAAPSEIIPGYQSGSSEPLWGCREALCRFDLGGEVGYGFLEISRRKPPDV